MTCKLPKLSDKQFQALLEINTNGHNPKYVRNIATNTEQSLINRGLVVLLTFWHSGPRHEMYGVIYQALTSLGAQVLKEYEYKKGYKP